MPALETIHDRAKGRWPGILMQLGLPPKALRNIHGPCPMCGGKDRFRFDNKNDTGSWFCNSCGYGNGLDLVMKFKNLVFLEAKKLIEGVVGGAPTAVRREVFDAHDISYQKSQMTKLWLRSLELTGKDIASRYLERRGITLERPYKFLRWAPAVPYWLDRECVGDFPCLLAKFVAPDARSGNIQRTFLREPGVKADLPDGARKTMAGPMPMGGAVRLGEPAEVMGVAEGVETALAASAINPGMPVWAVLSTAGMLRFEPPDLCTKLIIFGDSDERLAGQAAAYALGHRLMNPKKGARFVDCQVRVPRSGTPDDPWLVNKKDWNDELMRPRPELRLVK